MTFEDCVVDHLIRSAYITPETRSLSSSLLLQFWVGTHANGPAHVIEKDIALKQLLATSPELQGKHEKGE